MISLLLSLGMLKVMNLLKRKSDIFHSCFKEGIHGHGQGHRYEELRIPRINIEELRDFETQEEDKR